MASLWEAAQNQGTHGTCALNRPKPALGCSSDFEILASLFLYRVLPTCIVTHFGTYREHHRTQYVPVVFKCPARSTGLIQHSAYNP